ncbi:MAG: hypothetical protein AAB769_00675, partial [Patescibacteria group bacterium]
MTNQEKIAIFSSIFRGRMDAPTLRSFRCASSAVYFKNSSNCIPSPRFARRGNAVRAISRIHRFSK